MIYTISNNMDMELVLRCLLACICGFVVGFERTKHQKAAGIRTYIIVAVGAALFTIISKYGFTDAIGNGLRVDVSRVACNIVTGVGFLGAGTIFMRGNRIQGLATSAGIWAMAAIGMAIGTGMYLVGIVATVIVFGVQTFFSKFAHGRFGIKIPGKLIVNMNDDEKTLERLEKVLEKAQIEISSSHIKRNKDHMLTYTFGLQMPEGIDVQEIVEQISKIKSVRSIDL